MPSLVSPACTDGLSLFADVANHSIVVLANGLGDFQHSQSIGVNPSKGIQHEHARVAPMLGEIDEPSDGRIVTLFIGHRWIQANKGDSIGRLAEQRALVEVANERVAVQPAWAEHSSHWHVLNA